MGKRLTESAVLSAAGLPLESLSVAGERICLVTKWLGEHMLEYGD